MPCNPAQRAQDTGIELTELGRRRIKMADAKHFPSNANGGRLILRAEFELKEGEKLRVVGEGHALGQWHPEQGKEMERDPFLPSRPMWRAILSDADTYWGKQFKYVIVQPDRKCLWEDLEGESQNRTIAMENLTMPDTPKFPKRPAIREGVQTEENFDRSVLVAMLNAMQRLDDKIEANKQSWYRAMRREGGAQDSGGRQMEAIHCGQLATVADDKQDMIHKEAKEVETSAKADMDATIYAEARKLNEDVNEKIRTEVAMAVHKLEESIGKRIAAELAKKTSAQEDMAASWDLSWFSQSCVPDRKSDAQNRAVEERALKEAALMRWMKHEPEVLMLVKHWIGWSNWANEAKETLASLQKKVGSLMGGHAQDGAATPADSLQQVKTDMESLRDQVDSLSVNAASSESLHDALEQRVSTSERDLEQLRKQTEEKWTTLESEVGKKMEFQQDSWKCFTDKIHGNLSAMQVKLDSWEQKHEDARKAWIDDVQLKIQSAKQDLNDQVKEEVSSLSASHAAAKQELAALDSVCQEVCTTTSSLHDAIDQHKAETQAEINRLQEEHKAFIGFEAKSQRQQLEFKAQVKQLETSVQETSHSLDQKLETALKEASSKASDIIAENEKLQNMVDGLHGAVLEAVDKKLEEWQLEHGDQQRQEHMGLKQEVSNLQNELGDVRRLAVNAKLKAEIEKLNQEMIRMFDTFPAKGLCFDNRGAEPGPEPETCHPEADGVPQEATSKQQPVADENVAAENMQELPASPDCKSTAEGSDAELQKSDDPSPLKRTVSSASDAWEKVATADDDEEPQVSSEDSGSTANTGASPGAVDSSNDVATNEIESNASSEATTAPSSTLGAAVQSDPVKSAAASTAGHAAPATPAAPKSAKQAGSAKSTGSAGLKIPFNAFAHPQNPDAKAITKELEKEILVFKKKEGKTEEEKKSFVRDLRRKAHPDKNGGGAAHKEAFQWLQDWLASHEDWLMK